MHSSTVRTPGLKVCLVRFLQNWAVGDKTGTGSRGAVNDVATAVPPGGAPVLIAVYMSESDSTLGALEAAHVDIGKLIAQEP